ncbi:hypothetical protein IWW50_000966 [Coemansia erecta]|nr:hypothetical protein IWW50_000966 [Coemansia erecta]
MSMLQRKVSRLSPADEPPVYLGRSFTEDSSTANTMMNTGSSDSLAGHEPADRDTDNGHSTLVPFSGSGNNGEDESSMRRRNNNLWQASLLSPPLYCESIEEDSREETAAAAGAVEPETTVESPTARSVNAAASVSGDQRGRVTTYISKLPLHILGYRRSGSRAGPVGQAVGGDQRAAQSGERLWQSETLQSEALGGTKSVAADSSSSFFGGAAGDSSLVKRVSSVPGNLSLFRAHLTDPLLHPEFRAPPRYTQHQPIRLAVNEPDDTPMYGYALLVLTSVLFISSMYSLVVSKFMPYTGIAFLDAVKDDRYFCLLMPITGLSFTFTVFWNWLGMKFFRHSH